MFVTVSMMEAAQYAVIIQADSSIEKVTKKQLRNLYLKRQNFLDNQKIIPINLLANNTGRLAFEQHVLTISRKKLSKYWIREHFKGIRPPSTVASFKAALVFVQKVQGAIAYIPIDMLNNKVKVLYEY